MPRVGPVDAGEDLQQGALAGAVAADDPEELALADVEGDAVERPQLAVLAGGEGPDDALLERVDPVGRDPERLVEVLDLDRQRGVFLGGAAARRTGSPPRMAFSTVIAPGAYAQRQRGGV